MFLMDRRILIAIVINILNLLDMVVTWIATQVPHIDFFTAEKNTKFIDAYSEFLVGNSNPLFLLVLIKLLVCLLLSLYWIRIERHVFFAVCFGVIFSLYSLSTIVWIGLILVPGIQAPDLLGESLGLICLFIISFTIYYSPSELKDFFRDRIFNRIKSSPME